MTPSELERILKLEMDLAQCFVGVRKATKEDNDERGVKHFRVLILKTFLFIKDFTYAEIISDSTEKEVQLQEKTILNNILTEMWLSNKYITN